MAQPQFDSDHYRQRARQQWEKTAAGWNKWRPMLDQWEEELTEKIFELGQIGPGSRVLEVAAGNGSFSIAAAQRVGEDGYVLSTDMADNMVAYAADAAQEAGLTQMETATMSGENLTVDGQSFDVVVCRISLMLFADPQKGLSEAYRVLKPGGRYAVTVFTTPDKTPWLAIPGKVAFQHANRPMPPAGTPGIFALGGSGQLAQLMENAGFTDIQTFTFRKQLKLASAAECTMLVRETAGAIKDILAGLNEVAQQAAWQAIEAALGQLEGEGGFAAPSEMLLVVGTK